MSCKIKVDMYNKKAGKKCFLLMTQDAASLEARVATSDTVLNDDGIDPALYDVYKEGSVIGEDLHSKTSHFTFAAPLNLQILEIEDDSGKTWLCLEDAQSMWIERNGERIKVKGKEILESDKILGYEEDFKD